MPIDPHANPSAPISEINEIVAHLASSTLFGNIKREKLLPIAPIFETAHFNSGETISEQGQVDTTLRILVEGTVSLHFKDEEGRLEHRGLLGYGGAIGLRGVFADQPRVTSAVAYEPCTLLYIDGAVLWEVLRTDAEMLDNLVLTDEVRAKLRIPTGQAVSGGEAQIAIYRRHWLTAIPRIIGMPAFIFIFIAALVFPLSTLAGIRGSMAMLIMAFLALGGSVAAGIWLFFDYWHDFLSVTNRRVVHVERTPLIDERRSAARLERIQDVSFVQPNLLSRIIGYGDLSILTASSSKTVKFKGVAKPAVARDTIFAEVTRARDRAQSERQALIARKILAAVGAAPMQPAEAMLQASSVTEDESLGFLRPIFEHFIPRTRSEDPDGTVTWRKHWWVLLADGYLAFGLFGITTLAMAYITFSDWTRPATDAAAAAGTTTALADSLIWIFGLWLLLGLWAWWAYEDWRNDVYQLTDEMVIEIERLPLGLFASQRQAPLGQIQDVRFVMPNPIASILKFGTVIIETASESGGFTFDFVHHPESVQEEIFLRIDQKVAQSQRAEQDRRDDELIRWIAAYHRVTQFDPNDVGSAERLAEFLARNPPPKST